MKTYVEISGEEFIRGILDGRRDFSGIKLPDYFDLSGHRDFEKLKKYLKIADLEHNPLIIENSCLFGLKARGLYLPYVKGAKANLSQADLDYSYLPYADLSFANLSHASLCHSYLPYADLRNAKLFNAILSGTNLSHANLFNTDFTFTSLPLANLSGVRNLEDALNLGCVLFRKTRVTEKEKQIIEKELFIVEEIPASKDTSIFF